MACREQPSPVACSKFADPGGSWQHSDHSVPLWPLSCGKAVTRSLTHQPRRHPRTNLPANDECLDCGGTDQKGPAGISTTCSHNTHSSHNSHNRLMHFRARALFNSLPTTMRPLNLHVRIVLDTVFFWWVKPDQSRLGLTLAALASTEPLLITNPHSPIWNSQHRQ